MALKLQPRSEFNTILSLCNRCEYRPLEMTKGYIVNASPEPVKSSGRESLAADQAANHAAEVTPSSGASAKRFDRVTAPMNISMLAAQPWLQAAEAIVDWYGAVLGLAFGLGLVNSRREARGFVTAEPSPPTELREPEPVAPVQTTRAPVQTSRPPVALPLKRRKSFSAATSRSRSSKTSSVRRRRRAA